MGTWDKIFINSQNIKSESSSSYLIQMPNKSSYKGWAFWHPKKLVREQGGKGYHISFSFTDEFIFKVILYGRGKYNRMSVIRSEDISADEMKEIFGVVDKSVNDAVYQETMKIIEKEDVNVEITNHTPEKIEPISDNTINDLRK